MQEQAAKPDAISVSDALSIAKGALEALTIRLVGEVSEVSIKPGYKAAYFTVKDDKASLPCMMWNNRYKAQNVELEVGQLVELTGRFTLYAAKGRMSFDVFGITLSGEGELRMKVANIAKRLKAEGLTDPARKRPIPEFPETIGLVTSPRSAAVHDVLRTLRRRYPLATVLLAGVPVEGVHAAEQIRAGVGCVTQAGAEVVLIVRGGGSFEDLMPFNDEELARTIAACPVPVVTGIGHEVDTSIADMVSDLRASTPTAAAEATSPSPESLDALFASRAASLQGCMTRRFQKTEAYLQRFADKPVFRDPLLLFSSEAQWLDAISESLARALPERLAREGERLQVSSSRLKLCGPRIAERFGNQLATRAARLEDLSPVSTLARGYSITRNEAGEILHSTEGINAGDGVQVTLSDGSLNCTVQQVNEGELNLAG